MTGPLKTSRTYSIVRLSISHYGTSGIWNVEMAGITIRDSHGRSLTTIDGIRYSNTLVARKDGAQELQTSDLVIGVHIRRGDYATWHNGQFFYGLEEYHQFMLRVQELYIYSFCL